MATGSTAINEIAIALAFGLSIVAMANGVGQISGCHVNPAVSFGVYTAGRMTLEELLIYWVAQFAGAIAAALVLYLILSGKVSGWNGALGQTTWSEYSALSAFIFEVVGTFLFLVCILGVTQRGAPVGLAGIAIGLTLAAIHLVGINISGSSVNPARSFGPALVGFAQNPEALKQIWLYILAPLIGAGAAGYLFRSGVLAAETVIPTRGESGSDVPPAASAPRSSHPSSRFYPQRTEPSVFLHHVRIREASDHKCFCQPLVRLPRIGRKAKRNSGAGLHDPSHFSQTDGRIRPDLHGVNRQRLIKAVVIEWQANHGATPQVDTTVLDGGRVPSASLLDHLTRRINPRDMPC